MDFSALGSESFLKMMNRIGRNSAQSTAHRLGACYAPPTLNAAELLEIGFTCQISELLYEGMKLHRAKAISGVRRKARLPVKNGLNALRVLDEIDVLNEDEIFVQRRHGKTGRITPVTGRVIVGRSPCLHPGDL